MPIMQLYDKNTSTWQEVPALKGSAAKVEVGTVKTVPAAEQAKVTNVGTNTKQFLIFSFLVVWMVLLPFAALITGQPQTNSKSLRTSLIK